MRQNAKKLYFHRIFNSGDRQIGLETYPKRIAKFPSTSNMNQQFHFSRVSRTRQFLHMQKSMTLQWEIHQLFKMILNQWQNQEFKARVGVVQFWSGDSLYSTCYSIKLSLKLAQKDKLNNGLGMPCNPNTSEIPFVLQKNEPGQMKLDVSPSWPSDCFLS